MLITRGPYEPFPATGRVTRPRKRAAAPRWPFRAGRASLKA